MLFSDSLKCMMVWVFGVLVGFMSFFLFFFWFRDLFNFSLLSVIFDVEKIVLRLVEL